MPPSNNDVSRETTTVDQTICSISTLHPDIILTHILTRLDGPDLVATACTSSNLHSLTRDGNLWRELCTSTWPSVNDPRLQTLISMFPSGHRSLFSDSYPVLDLHPPSKTTLDSIPPTTGLVSAVDLFYQNDLIFSKVEETETVTGWFQFPPFRIDLVGEKELVPTPIPYLREGDDHHVLLKQLEEKLSLSWIVIDSGARKAVNLSSRWPVSVQRHWLTHDVHVKYAVIMAGDGWGVFSTRELLECEVMVTLGGKEGGEMHVKGVTMQMKDMEERNLSGKDSLVILRNAMIADGKRKRGRRKEAVQRYMQFLERKSDKKQRKQNIETVLNVGCLTGFIAFCSIKLFIRFTTMLFTQQ